MIFEQIRAGNDTHREDSGGLFVFIGPDAETQWLAAEIARDDRSYVLTGDVRVAAAVREGSMAIAFVHQFLQHAASAGRR